MSAESQAAAPLMAPAVQAAVEQLYGVFRKYRAPTQTLDVCLGCCVDPMLEKQMRALPLRQLSGAHFFEYNGSARSTPQPVAEIKYLLPRMLELLALGEEIHHSAELYLTRVGACEPGAFSSKEQAAIDAFSLAFFEEGLRQYGDCQRNGFMGNNAFDILLMFDIGGVAIEPLLAAWLGDDTAASTLHYVDASYLDFWKEEQIDNAFASDRPAFCEAMQSWLLDDGNRASFARKIMRIDVDALGEDVSVGGAGARARDIVERVFDLMTY